MQIVNFKNSDKNASPLLTDDPSDSFEPPSPSDYAPAWSEGDTPLISMFPNFSTQDWDNLVVMSAAAYNPSSIVKSSEIIGLPRPVADICSYLLATFCDMDKYQKFLDYREKSAQYLLDTLQGVSFNDK